MDFRPLTNAFGTRLDPDELLARLAALGLAGARLVVGDDEVVLECADPDIGRDDVARGLTWLRAQFSPLVPMRAAPLGGADGVLLGPRFVDARTRPLVVVALSEIKDRHTGLAPAIDDLLRRIAPMGQAKGAAAVTAAATTTGGVPRIPATADPALASLARQVAAALATRIPSASSATVSLLVPTRQGFDVVGPVASPTAQAANETGPHFLCWLRPGGPQGIGPATILAASWRLDGLGWLAAALPEYPRPMRAPRDGGLDVLLDGLVWKVGRRPIIAAPALAPDDAFTTPSPVSSPAPSPKLSNARESPIRVDAERCTSCGVCAEACPEDFLDGKGQPTAGPLSRCTRCYDCIEACPTDALRPAYHDDSATRGATLSHKPGWLSRLTGAAGPSFPAPFPPSYLRRKTAPAAGPRWVLGLAVMTMQEHAAVLLRDGEIVGAIEHERLVRIRHAGWHPPGRPGVTAAVDPTISLEETFCRRPIRALLEQAGITLDDLDLIAINGLHGRYADRISFVDADVPIPTIRTGRVVYLPHHLCHAASAFRAAGVADAWVLTVDGRGDRECAALWRGHDGKLAPKATLLSLTDRSIGGVYEGVTRVLGFGSHGQGSVMALASFGVAGDALHPFLHVGEGQETSISESGLAERFADFRRQSDQPIERRHQDLAASLQAALEASAVAFVRLGAGDGPLAALCLAGGVALNCKMNERLRRTFVPAHIFVQPAANDAGTALGAALEAWANLATDPAADSASPASPKKLAPPMQHSYLGPSFTDEEIEPVLRRAGLRYHRSDDVAKESAVRIADGQVLCWFQGRMEFGPRALGARSILADPRKPEMHARVNRMKEREAWRPFGPSILSGHEREWLDGGFDARFMVFTMPVLAEKRALVPAVVHVDGTTRPQVVHRETAPLYHALIEEFHRLTGIPMVLNTSFNRRGEPIVCTPDDAVASFLGLGLGPETGPDLGLGLDRGSGVLAIGNFIVEPVRVEKTLPTDETLAALGGGRRLSLRLTTKCDLACGHCTLGDLQEKGDRSENDALRALAEGRAAGCDELVILRGEASLRPDLPRLIARARGMGYRFVQLQTNGHALAALPWRDQLFKAGIDSFEVMLLAPDEPLHDELSGRPGSFRPTLLALRAIAQSGRQLLVTVPVLRRNMQKLGAIATVARKLGAGRIQFNFPRPVELPGSVVTEPLPRLAQAAAYVRQAAQIAAQLGMTVSTEAFPFCHLPPELHAAPDATEDWSRHRIDDLHLVHESLDEKRRTQRPESPPCRGCSARARCPKTWGLYLELYGSDELLPLTPPAPLPPLAPPAPVLPLA